MKLDFLVDFKANRLESHFIVSTILGAAMLLVGIFWDSIIGVQAPHNKGFGMGQVIWVVSWGVYTLWSFLMAAEWGE